MQHERRERIVDIVNTRGLISLAELEKLFPQVSSMTLRRDLQFLDEHGELIRVRRGARSIQTHANASTVEPIYVMRAHDNLQAKDAIAAAALPLVQAERSIFLDAGSTAMRLAHILPDQPYTVVTPAPNIALEIVKRQYPEVILLGGSLHRDNLNVSGDRAIEMLKDININTAIVSTSGYLYNVGFTCGDLAECELKKTVLKRARKKIMIMDQSKINRMLPLTFGTAQDIDILVVDGPLHQEHTGTLVRDLEEHNVQIILAEQK